MTTTYPTVGALRRALPDRAVICDEDGWEMADDDEVPDRMRVVYRYGQDQYASRPHAGMIMGDGGSTISRATPDGAKYVGSVRSKSSVITQACQSDEPEYDERGVRRSR